MLKTVCCVIAMVVIGVFWGIGVYKRERNKTR